jgi:peroxiredoxin family protein
MSSPPLFILLCSGEHEKIQMAAMTASVAAVSDRAVEVFVSMNALAVFRKDVEGQRYSGGEFSKVMQQRNVPDAIELFGQGKMLGEMKVYACSMAMDVAGIEIEDLVEDLVDDAGGLTKFLADAESGQLIVF